MYVLNEGKGKCTKQRFVFGANKHSLSFPQTKVQVDVGLHEGLLSQYATLHEEVAPHFRRAVDDVHDGLDLMIGLGALGVGLYTASRLLHATYWVLDWRAEKTTRWWKQVVALVGGGLVVGGVCTLGVGMTRAAMLKRR